MSDALLTALAPSWVLPQIELRHAGDWYLFARCPESGECAWRQVDRWSSLENARAYYRRCLEVIEEQMERQS